MKTFSRILNLGVLLALSSLILTITSCDKIKEILTVSISTTIEGNIPIQVGIITHSLTESNYGATKASAINYNVNHDVSIADNPDLKPYLTKIKEIDIKSIEVTFLGLKEGEIIDFISISVIGVGEIASIINVTNSNNIFSPTVSVELLKSVSKDLLNKNKITINVKGGTNGPLSAFANLKMNAKVKAQALD